MNIDYKEYEDRVRKVDSGYMMGVLKKYVSHFQGRQRVLDIACGRGDFLSLAKEAGINAMGIDNDLSIVKDATGRGLTVQRCSAFEFLENNKEPFDGVFCSQFIEHLGPDDLMRLLTLIHRNLTDDGIIILTTPNPRSLIVHLQSFYKDFSHVRFYDLELVKFMMECAGLKVTDAGFDQDTAFQMPLMPQCTVENNALASIREHLSHKDPENVQAPPPQQVGERLEFPRLDSSDGYRYSANKLKPARLKGLVNGVKYYADLVIYRLIRRYLSGVYDDMGRYNKALTEQQGMLIKNQEQMYMCQSRLIEMLDKHEVQLKEENDTLSAILELIKMNEASYNGFIRDTYQPHDIYVIGVKRVKQNGST